MIEREARSHRAAAGSIHGHVLAGSGQRRWPAGRSAARAAAFASLPHAAPHHAGKPWFLALTALGIVYGDIGTSPLYAFQVALAGLGHRAPTAADVFGIVSLTFWALMLMVSLKYVVLVLRADNDGEGGILALLSLVAADRIRDGAALPILVLLGVVGRRTALRRRRHHAGDFGAVGDGRTAAGRAVVHEPSSCR